MGIVVLTSPPPPNSPPPKSKDGHETPPRGSLFSPLPTGAGKGRTPTLHSPTRNPEPVRVSMACPFSPMRVMLLPGLQLSRQRPFWQVRSQMSGAKTTLKRSRASAARSEAAAEPRPGQPGAPGIIASSSPSTRTAAPAGGILASRAAPAGGQAGRQAGEEEEEEAVVAPPLLLSLSPAPPGAANLRPGAGIWERRQEEAEPEPSRQGARGRAAETRGPASDPQSQRTVAPLQLRTQTHTRIYTYTRILTSFPPEGGEGSARDGEEEEEEKGPPIQPPEPKLSTFSPNFINFLPKVYKLPPQTLNFPPDFKFPPQTLNFIPKLKLSTQTLHFLPKL